MGTTGKKSPDEVIGPDRWVNEYGDMLYSLALRRLRDQDTAAEVVQEALLAGVRGWKNFKGDSSVRTWLVSILKNKIIDHIRKASRRDEVQLIEQRSSEVDSHFNRAGIWNRILSDWGREPDQILEGKEFMSAFERCMSGLPEKYRRAFVLKVLDNCNTDEICKILSLTSSNLGVLIYRARMRLRDCLEQNWVSAK
jgi:RNA polymerase sigma-70 factor (TIGR02943 family)